MSRAIYGLSRDRCWRDVLVLTVVELRIRELYCRFFLPIIVGSECSCQGFEF